MVTRMNMTKRTGFVAFLLLMGLFAVGAFAQIDAYSVEVAVYDKSDSERSDAYQVALRRVLRNNSGDKTVLNRDLVRQELNQAENYVNGFSYRTPPPGTIIANDTPITDKVRRSGQATQLMLISFDRALVAELIDSSAPSRTSQADEPAPVSVLDTNSALVWLLIQDEGRDIRISDPAAINVQSRAREIAGAVGMSLVFPSGDAEDQLALTTEDMLMQNMDKVLAASARYGQDMVLLGTLSRLGAQGWRGNWVRSLGTELQQSSFDTATLDEAMKEGLKVLTSAAAIDESFRYGGGAVSEAEALVWVGSITSTEDYARMMRFLESQPSVSTVYPKEISETSMVFSVVPRSALIDIESAIQGVPWLRRSAPPVTTVSNSLVRNVDVALEYSR